MLAFSADILSLSAIELSSSLHSRQITAVELLTKTLDRIEDVDPKIKAIVSLKGVCYVVHVMIIYDYAVSNKYLLLNISLLYHT